MPSVTVLMPVFNGERFVRRAVESILTQTYRDFELLVVNDGSSDASREIVLSYADADPRIRLVDNPHNIGLTASLNRGLRLATGELIARQDADDASHPERLERQVAAMRRYQDVVLLGTCGRLVDADGAYVGAHDCGLDRPALLWWSLFANGLLHSSVVFRRRVALEEYGGFDESFTYCQDYELWSRLMADRPVASLSDRLIDYRTHGASMTHTVGSVAEEETRRVIRRNVAATLGSGALDSRELELVCQFRHGVGRDDLPAFHRLLRRMLATFRERYPAAVRSDDFWRTVARQYVVLLGSGRSAASAPPGAAVGRTLQTYAALIGDVARPPVLARCVALALSEELARHVARRWRQGARRVPWRGATAARDKRAPIGP